MSIRILESIEPVLNSNLFSLIPIEGVGVENTKYKGFKVVSKSEIMPEINTEDLNQEDVNGDNIDEENDSQVGDNNNNSNNSENNKEIESNTVNNKQNNQQLQLLAIYLVMK